MINNGRKLRVLWIILGLLSLMASSIGVFNPNIYDKVLDASILPATIVQDLMTMFVSLLVIVLALRFDTNQLRQHLIIIGSLGFFFYAYMIYAIERLYLVYLGVIGLSFYSIVYSILSIEQPIYSEVSISKNIRRLSSGYNILSAGVFSLIWISQLIPLMQSGNKPEFLYSIYIIDLCFILPTLVISGLLALRGNGFGVLMLVPTSIIGFTILAPLWLSELMKPVFYGYRPSYPEMSLFLVVSTIFLVLTIFDLRSLENE